MAVDLTCPFCGETDFDDVGLKIHLERGHCEKYNAVDVDAENRASLKAKQETVG